MCKLKSVLLLNWIVWNRIYFMYKNGFGIRYTTVIDIQKTKQNKKNKSNQTKRVFFFLVSYLSVSPEFFGGSNFVVIGEIQSWYI